MKLLIQTGHRSGHSLSFYISNKLWNNITITGPWATLFENNCDDDNRLSLWQRYFFFLAFWVNGMLLVEMVWQCTVALPHYWNQLPLGPSILEGYIFLNKYCFIFFSVIHVCILVFILWVSKENVRSIKTGNFVFYF